jgi:myo-inositol 2-dehydrogenase / D-chiro-inositol 1-dehydrogenase
VHCAHRGPQALPTFTSEMLITDSAIHELDLMRWLLDEEVTATTVLKPRRTAQDRPELHSPQIVLLETESGVLIDVEVFVNCRYGYDIRCEVVGELGTVALADDAGVIVRHGGERAGRVPSDWIERFEAAYDAEMQAWVNSVVSGEAVGPNSWDGYAATAVATACLESLSSGHRTKVHMVARPEFYA